MTISQLLFKHFRINWLFYIGLLISIYIFSKGTETSYTRNIITLIIVSLLQYIVHLFGHKYRIKNIVTSFIEKNTFITGTNFVKVLLMNMADFVDFHYEIHHDTKINKRPENQIFEFIHNFFTQGVIVYVITWFIKGLNAKIALIWGMVYATMHMINYQFIDHPEHVQHHENSETNYGHDIWDILFNTKYDDSCENYNHVVINSLVFFYVGSKIFK